jgi:hypothetical protein
VPSGSTFTNEVDSIAQYLCAKDFGIDDSCMDIQGDDGVYSTDRPEALIEHFESYGLKVNSSKSLTSMDQAIYLQQIYELDSIKGDTIGGVYSTYRALCRIIYPERYNKYSVDGISGADFNSIRAISILENCSYHPLFEELVKFVASIDKINLQFSEAGLLNYIRRVNKTEGTQGIFDYRRGDRLKGIKSFKTFALLSKL